MKMKPLLALPLLPALGLLLLLPALAADQDPLACPPAGSSVPLSVLPHSGPTTVRVQTPSASSALCLLLRRDAATGARRAAVARSYAGRDWELSPGVFAKSASGAGADCAAAPPGTCDVALPALEAGAEYALESWTHALSVEGTAARFLEQATFGPTREAIDELVAAPNPNDFASWVEAQIALPPSSLRAFYRARTNPKFEYPYRVGATGARPCERFSRWRRHALTSRDWLSNRKTGWFKHLTVDLVDGKYVWKVDGHFRTVTTEAPELTDGSAMVLGARYRITLDNGNAWKADCVGCPVKVNYNGQSKTLLNPPVSVAGIESDASVLPYPVVSLPDYRSSDLPSIEDASDYPLFGEWIKPFENALLNTTSLEGSDQCDGFPSFRRPFPLDGADSPPGTFPSVFGRSTDAVSGEVVVFAFDPHLGLQENTVENPLMDGGGQLVMDTEDIVMGTQVLCQNAERSFLNEDHCKLSYLPNVCAPGKKPKKVVVLDEANLAGINADTGKELYAVVGLPITDAVDSEGNPYLKAPCASSTSRWAKDEADAVCANTAGLGPVTLATFSDLISGREMTTNAHNKDVVDVKRSVRDCDGADAAKLDLGKVRAADGSCWKHVHRSEYSVIDLTGANMFQYSLEGVRANFANEMDYFYNTIANETLHPVIGTLGDHVELDGSEPAPLDTQAVQDAYHTIDYNPSMGPVLVCGSPNEVASDPFYGDRGFDVVIPEGTGTRSFSIWEYSAQRHTTWTHLALHAADQLRMKMAWSLSQIIAIGLPGSGMVFNEETEHYLALFDIFVTNSFGNYLNIMREIAYNNINGGWLTYKGNKSLQYNIDQEGEENYPDENFAREMMQLFSIGLYEMEMDGSQVMGENGLPQETYTIESIMSYARAWTGLTSPNERGGVSVAERQWTDKRIDPMVIDPSTRDLFPKNDLNDGYIGDRVALCEDLPAKHFLRKGATYRALGSSPNPEMHDDSGDWSQNPDFRRLQVLPSSPLYDKLCAADADGHCTLPSKVVLEENLVYDTTAQSLAEYSVDTIRTVQLSVGLSNPTYYEYIRQPCVELAFFNDAKKVIKGQVWPGDPVIEPSLCGNPKLEIAAPMCMSNSTWGVGKIECNYQGERTTYATAEAMCDGVGMSLGHPGSVKEPRAGACADGLKNRKFRSWSNAWCKVQVKVDMKSGGYVAIVNEVEPDFTRAAAVESLVGLDTLNFFKTAWDNGIYPASLEDCSSTPSCVVHGEQYCICDTDSSLSQVFDAASEVSSIDQLMSDLPIGAVDPAVHDVGTYQSLGDCGIPDVTVYTKLGDCITLSPNTIFAFEHKSKQYFLKNEKSTVHIQGSNYSFRNPVSFNNLADPERRDMHHETESVLESLFYHPTHPPFIASRLIQRFGVSNPSPSFIERAATAYKTGSFDNGRFGSGGYGDLGALVAAIVLDDETRQAVLDADPAHGHLREPLIKVLSFFRSMHVRFASPLHIPTLLSTESKIGQGSFESPSVFSFFLPEYTPLVGSVQSAGLVAPEAMVLSGDNVLDLHESIFSSIKFGVTKCYKPSLEGWRVMQPFSCANTGEGDTSLSPAAPQFWPTSTASVDDILDELAILFTAGRLSDKNKMVIKSIVEPEYNGGDVAKAVRMAQELIFASPETHTTGVTRNLNDLREIAGYTEIPAAPYKAVVVLMMDGGADSWNLLVPVSDCSTSNQYQEYIDARGSNHLPLSNLTLISAALSSQGCQTFGVNKDFDVLAQLYNDTDALFLANTGILSKQVTNDDDWNGEQRTQLFAHNSMVHEFYRIDPYETNANTGVLGRMLDKLKLQGYQTSANTRGAGRTMLSGDQQYNNPVYGVSTTAPQPLNQDPTIENIYEVVKELNGAGEAGTNVMSETWSSRVAASLYEHEQMIEISTMPGFDIENYGGESGDGGGGSLSNSFKTIVEHMKSREFRKVNREAFVLKQTGFDHHASNAVSDKFASANSAINSFVTELKNQGLWQNTVLVMGSDFGRSLNPNSNGGTDHGWGGNYFMAGGSLKGGRIIGHYPQPLSPEHPNWIGRGRFIPTTPWDSVWNAVAQWMGVVDDADLDFVLPNRYRFDKCSVLFNDKDLFEGGACTCTECTEITWSPTPAPPPPTLSPTRLPGVFYEAEDATLGGGTKVGAGNLGWYGSGYANMGGSGSFIEFTEIDGGAGGMCVLSFRYANGGSAERPCEVEVNGVVVGTVTFAPTSSSWEQWQYGAIETECGAGSNTIRITASTGEGGPNVDSMNHAPSDSPPPPPTPSPTRLPGVFYEAEDQTLSGTNQRSGNDGFYGSGYADMGGAGTYVEFTEIDGGAGGMCVLSFRYANGGAAERPCEVKVNDVVVGTLTFAPTSSSWEQWEYDAIETECGAGMNTIRVTASTGAGGPNIDGMNHAQGGSTDSPTANPTKSPTKNPTESSESPTTSPTQSPSAGPSAAPSKSPTSGPTNSPSKSPSSPPSKTPTASPTASPVESASSPSKSPTTGPTNSPSKSPSSSPSKTLTASPTASPVESTSSPSKSPTTGPTANPTSSPSKNPTTAPSPSATTPLSGEYVNTIFDVGSTVTNVGCTQDAETTKSNVCDSSTEKWYCTMSMTEPTGIVVQPSHRNLSIAKKLRVYSHNNCPNCDAVSYIVSGREDANSPWIEIRSGHLPWRDYTPGRNDRGLPISSTYESADPARESCEVDMSSNSMVYLDYKVQFPESRSGGTSVQAAEIELPGFVIAPPPTPSPTDSPTISLPDGLAVNSIFEPGSSTFDGFGGCSTPATNAFDGSTKKYSCSGTANDPMGFSITPASGQMSVAKKFRLYSHNNCPNCDAVSYILEGRVDANSPWFEISSGDLPWIDGALPRNPKNAPISSSYESGDSSRSYTEAVFPNNGNAYLEYKVTFTELRNPDATLLQLGEIELPGFLL